VAEPSGLHYPNRIARYFFLAMEDVMGQAGLNMVLSLGKQDDYIGQYPPDNLAGQFDFASMAAIQQALEDVYGSRGGRGMALRIGRACFSQGMKSFGALAGMSDPAFRALPREERCRMGLQALAAVFNKFTDQHSELEEDDKTYRFVVEVSPMAWGRHTDKPVCHALAGILQECLRWASNGHEYIVYETACHAVGDDHCVFTINKTPIGFGR
jgi:predicted hydrocarbon binding protein